MNRRNFVVGLGTVATVSGVASVTAASFADSVTSGADFRVVVDEQLIVRRGEDAETNNSEEWDSTNLDGDNLDDSDFEEAVGEDDAIAVYVNDETDTDLQVNLAVLNDDDEGTHELDELLEVENDGATDHEVQILFDFGEDVGDEQDVDEDTVIELFEFYGTESGEQISPDDVDEGEQQEPDASLSVGAGEVEEIDLHVNIGDTAEAIADGADVDPFDGGSEETLDLVDAIEVGIDFDDGGD